MQVPLVSQVKSSFSTLFKYFIWAQVWVLHLHDKLSLKQWNKTFVVHKILVNSKNVSHFERNKRNMSSRIEALNDSNHPSMMMHEAEKNTSLEQQQRTETTNLVETWNIVLCARGKATNATCPKSKLIIHQQIVIAIPFVGTFQITSLASR